MRDILMQDDSVRRPETLFTYPLTPDGLVRITSFHRPQYQGHCQIYYETTIYHKGTLFFAVGDRTWSEKANSG
jgi:hypothetical protein